MPIQNVRIAPLCAGYNLSDVRQFYSGIFGRQLTVAMGSVLLHNKLKGYWEALNRGATQESYTVGERSISTIDLIGR